MNTLNNTLILASSSPRRKELLKQARINFTARDNKLDEEVFFAEKLKQEKNPEKIARELARAKALSIASDFPENPVLAVDTLVCLKGKILGKPKDREDACKILKFLSGAEHMVISGLSILLKEREVSFFVSSRVQFTGLSEEDINWYTGTEEPYDKAGAYAVQGLASRFIKSIKGSYTNIIGLPLCELIEKLKDFNIYPDTGKPDKKI